MLKSFLFETVADYGKERLTDIVTISTNLQSFVRLFHDEISDLDDAIWTTLDDQPLKLQLPASVVNAFEQYVMVIAYHEFAARYVDHHSLQIAQGQSPKASNYMRRLIALHKKLALRRQQAFDACFIARKDIGLMMSALQQPSSISVRAVHPSFLVVHLMRGLLSKIHRSSTGAFNNVIQLHTTHVAKLVR